MKKLFLYIIFSFSFILTYAQSGNGYEKTVADFMEVTNAKQTTISELESIYQNMNLQVSNMHRMCEEIVEAIWQNMIKGYTTIMQEYYTLDEINAIISFYKTPVGKKFAKYNPEVVQRAMEFGMRPEMINLVKPILLKYTNKSKFPNY